MSLRWLVLACCACVTNVGHSDYERPDARVVIDTASDAAVPVDTAIDGPPLITLSQTSSQQLVKNASVGCVNGGGYTEENEWYRVFDLPSYGIVETFHVQQVTFAVDTNVGTNKTVNVKIGRYDGAPTNPLETGASDFAGLVTLIAQTSVAIPPTDTGVFITAEFDADVPAYSKLIVEVQSAVGGYFFIGSTNVGQSETGYLRAPACGRSKPVTVATLGFPNADLLMNVIGTK